MPNDNMSLISDEQYNALEALLRAPRSKKTLQQAIVNTPFSDRLLTATIDLGIVVLLIANKKDNVIERVALSDTELAKGAVNVSAKPFHEISIPMRSKDNSIARAIRTKKYQLVDDWQFLFTPVLSAEEARRNQAGASIECSLVWPLKSGDGGAMIFSFYQPAVYIGNDHLTFSERYADLVDTYLERLNS